MRNRIKIFFGITLLGLSAFGQPNSWIDFNQQFIKVKVAEDGFYRITATELEAVGFPTATVASSRLRLFRRGEELSIRTSTSNGVILDYLEFWGQRNTGISDEELYLKNAQPHQGYNLFTDTATYFLTWDNSTTGKRISSSTVNDNSGLTAEPYLIQTIDSIQTSDYGPGRKFDFESVLSLSAYDLGEGWTGQFFTKNGFQEFSLNLDAVMNSGPDPELSLTLIGGNSQTHFVQINVGPDNSNLTAIDTATFNGHTFLNHLSTIPWSAVSSGGELVIRLTVIGQPEIADRVSFARVKVTYPQETVTGSQSFHFQNEISNGERIYYEFTSADPAGFEFFDITDPSEIIKLPTATSMSTIDLVVENPDVVHHIVGVNSVKNVGSLESFFFDRISFGDSDYLIITDPFLRDHNGSDPVANYKDYRESTSGGSHKVLIAEIQEIYDQFNYGDPSPLAIKKLVESGYPRLENVLILGKGRTPNVNFFRNQNSDQNFIDNPVMIPTYGHPGSDVQFSIGLDPVNPTVPAIPVGRLSAYTAEDVQSYLDKVIEMEAIPFDALWRKNLIQLSGGQTSSELSRFSGYISNFKEIAEGDFLGGKARNQGKQTSAVSEFFSIAEEVNNGVGLVTLFGHSSNTVTDIEIGRPSEQSSDGTNYNNQGKYPVVLVNGCQAGEIFGTTFSFGEDWMVTPSKGSIAFIAHANFAFANELNDFSTHFYNQSFGSEENFGRSIGQIIQSVDSIYLAENNNSDRAFAQAYQTLLQGDPAIKIFGASAPDYAFEPNGIAIQSIVGDRVLASQDSFLLRLVVNNFGRTTLDSTTIHVDRTLPSGELISYQYDFPRTKYQDTLLFPISNKDLINVNGENRFEITIDPLVSVPEINESNNLGVISFFIAEGNTINLLPQDFARVENGINRTLKWQPINILEDVRRYSLQIDSTDTFDSPFSQTEILEGREVMEYTMNLASRDIPDSTTIFWRTRFEEQRAGEDTIWSTSSFVLVADSISGWIQNQTQLNQNDLSGLVSNNGNLEFEKKSTSVDIEVTGTTNYDYDGLKVVVNNIDLLQTVNTSDPFCLGNTFNAIAIDRSTGQLFRPISFSGSDAQNSLVCGKLPQMVYNLTKDNMLTDRRIEELVAGLKPMDHIVFFSFDSVAYSTWDDQIFSAFEEIGVDRSFLSGLVDGQPLIIHGRKDQSLGEATVVINNGTVLPIKQQEIDFNQDLSSQVNAGILSTSTIGPATQWGELNYDIISGGSDEFSVNVIGITSEGDQVNLTSLGSIDEGPGRITDEPLETIDASLYPFLSLNVNLSDDRDFTPPQINSISVGFEPRAEGVLISGFDQIINVKEGQPIVADFSFVNISDQNFTDSLSVTSTLKNVNSGESVVLHQKIAPVLARDSISFELTFESRGNGGQNDLRVSVESQGIEPISVNNIVNISGLASVEEDMSNPILDVTFDGNYIMNRDLVSANPTIFIKLKDENQFLLKDDTTGIEVSLKLDGEGEEYRRYSFRDSQITWRPATPESDFEIELNPISLPNGVHSLRIQATDEGGNQAAELAYEIDFEVINESSITHFYPYPNPFSTSCRFVFTLTGSVVPDNLKIQIMTISGRVVREIRNDEFGPIRIGNNISDFVWDGTDEYGDKLANGVYLYRVITEYLGDSFEHRSTGVDNLFNKGFGKLYILR